MSNAEGCDISVWQDDNSTPQKVDFQKMYAGGKRFVMIKSSQANWMDEDFLWNWKASKESGLLRGAYHFLTWDVDPKKQADFVLGLVREDPAELGVWADYEWWDTVPNNALQIVDTFCARIEQSLNRCGIYTAPGFWQPYGSEDPKWIKRPLWIASWNDTSPKVFKPWTDWTFWQYTPKGDGIALGCESKQVDLDYFNGTYEDLLKFAHAEPQPVPDLKAQIQAKIAELSALVEQLP
jgi:lysozyme